MKKSLIKIITLSFLISSAWAGRVGSDIYTDTFPLKDKITTKKSNIKSEVKNLQSDRSNIENERSYINTKRPHTVKHTVKGQLEKIPTETK